MPKPNKKQSLTKSKVSFWVSIWHYMQKWYVILGVIVFFVGLIPLWKSLVKETKTPIELFRDEKNVAGILLPDALLSGKKDITILAATNEIVFSIPELMRGVHIQPTALSVNDGDFECINLQLKIIDNRVVVSSTLKNLKGEIIGVLKDNNWTFVKDKVLDCYADGKNIEVIDEFNNVVFRLTFNGDNLLTYSGYSVGVDEVCVISDKVVVVPTNQESSKAFLAKALKEIVPAFSHPTINSSP